YLSSPICGTSTSVIFSLSLHDVLPISRSIPRRRGGGVPAAWRGCAWLVESLSVQPHPGQLCGSVGQFRLPPLHGNPKFPARRSAIDIHPPHGRRVCRIWVRAIPVPGTRLRVPVRRPPHGGAAADGCRAHLQADAECRSSEPISGPHPSALCMGDSLNCPVHAELLPHPPRGDRGGRSRGWGE